MAGIKVGIIGLTTPNIPRWDGPKVTHLDFEPMYVAAEKYIEELKEKESVDIIIGTVHAGVEGEYDSGGGDSARKVIETNPEIVAMLVGALLTMNMPGRPAALTASLKTSVARRYA